MRITASLSATAKARSIASWSGIVTGGRGRAHRVFDAETGKLIREYSFPKSKQPRTVPGSWDAFVSRDGERFWTTEHCEQPRLFDGIYEWNVATGESQRISRDHDPCHVLFDEAHKHLILNTPGGEVRILDAGHELPVEKPAELTATLDRFLTGSRV